MDERIKLLDVGDDVLLFDEHFMLKVGRFKKEVRQNFQVFAEEFLNYGRKHLQINQSKNFQMVTGSFNSISWRCTPHEGISCEVLCFGANSWQKGKLRVSVLLESLPILEEFQYSEDKKIDEELRKNNIQKSDLFDIQVWLEFIPDNSPLREISTANPLEMNDSGFPIEQIRRIIS